MTIPLNQVLCAELVMRGQAAAGGSNAKNIAFVFHYRRAAVAVNPTKTALNTIFQANVAAPIVAALNVRYAATFNDVRWLDDAEDPYQPFASALVGAIAGDSMDTFSAAYILFRTAVRGRFARGSKHLGPMSEADSTGGTDDLFNAAALTRLGTVATAMLANLTDATGNIWTPCVVSRKAPAQYKVNPTTVVRNDVTQVLVNKRIGSMRKRKVASVY